MATTIQTRVPSKIKTIFRKKHSYFGIIDNNNERDSNVEANIQIQQQEPPQKISKVDNNNKINNNNNNNDNNNNNHNNHIQHNQVILTLIDPTNIISQLFFSTNLFEKLDKDLIFNLTLTSSTISKIIHPFIINAFLFNFTPNRFQIYPSQNIKVNSKIESYPAFIK